MADETKSASDAPAAYTGTPAAAEGSAGLTASAAQESSRITQALQHLQSILVPGETVQAYAVQRRGAALGHRRSIVAATTGRFIAVTREMFGGFTPLDVRWQDVAEAHLHVGIFWATVSVLMMGRQDLASTEHTGQRLSVDGLRKAQAEQVYRVCQAQSQAWREKRRIRDLDELRARSGGLQLGGSGSSIPAGAAGAGDADPVARLQRAKEMLAQGLITDAEFESIKAKIVDRL